MPERPAKCYGKIDRPPYTRKEYIRGFPPPKIRIFDMGDPSGNFRVKIGLIALEGRQVRHNALEAARIAANKYLTGRLSRSNYHLKVTVYPHHVLRENKMMAFAGADRLQDGMRKAFGKPIGTAARVRAGQRLMFVRVNDDDVDVAVEALRRAAMKFPMKCRVVVEEAPPEIKKRLGF